MGCLGYGTIKIPKNGYNDSSSNADGYGDVRLGGDGYEAMMSKGVVTLTGDGGDEGGGGVMKAEEETKVEAPTNSCYTNDSAA